MRILLRSADSIPFWACPLYARNPCDGMKCPVTRAATSEEAVAFLSASIFDADRKRLTTLRNAMGSSGSESPPSKASIRRTVHKKMSPPPRDIPSSSQAATGSSCASIATTLEQQVVVYTPAPPSRTPSESQFKEWLLKYLPDGDNFATASVTSAGYRFVRSKRVVRASYIHYYLVCPTPGCPAKRTLKLGETGWCPIGSDQPHTHSATESVPKQRSRAVPEPERQRLMDLFRLGNGLITPSVAQQQLLVEAARQQNASSAGAPSVPSLRQLKHIRATALGTEGATSDIIDICHTYSIVRDVWLMRQGIPGLCMLLASSQSLQTLAKYGNNLSFVDGTHGLIVGAFQLVSVAVQVQGYGIPTAFFITQAHDMGTYQKMFRSLGTPLWCNALIIATRHTAAYASTAAIY